MAMRLEPSRGPIYLQLAREVSRWLARGDLRPGDKLPSIRALAERFRVNPNTIVQVYGELERRGITHTRRGQGTFVRQEVDVEGLRRALLAEAAQAFLEEVSALGLGMEEAIKALQEVTDARQPERGD